VIKRRIDYKRSVGQLKIGGIGIFRFPVTEDCTLCTRVEGVAMS
jgi:hypothetical protein